MTGRINLDDTSSCPLGHRCESCGTESEGLAVETVDAGPLGVMCLTLCVDCSESDVIPPVTVGTAVRLVGQHAGHLGIDVGQMAAELEGGDR